MTKLTDTVIPVEHMEKAIHMVRVSASIPDNLEAPKHPRQFSLTAVFLFVTYLCLLAAAGRVLCQFRPGLQRWIVSTDTGSSVLHLVFPVVFLTITLAIAAFATHGFSLALASRRWPRTTGVIVRSCVVEDRGGDTVTLVAEIHFSFEVDGQSYAGDTWTFNRTGDETRRFAERAVQRYPVGRQVTVYYDAANPGRNCLEPGVTPRVYVLALFVMVVLGVAGVAMLVGAWP